MRGFRYFLPGGGLHKRHRCKCSDAEHRCGDCGAKEGEIHKYGCDMERCPFCGGQLMSCKCRYEHLGYHPDPYKKHYGLPVDVYRHGLSDDERQEWRCILDEVGRVPHLVFHYSCGRCGEREPEMYMVPTWMWWTYIPIKNQLNTTVCFECFKKIKALIDKRSGLHPGEFAECPVCHCLDERCEYCLGEPVDSRMVRRILEDHEVFEEDSRKFKAMMAESGGEE